MTFREFALKNVRGSWHRYVAFFLSCVFSVMIFFIFADFIYHPSVVNGSIRAAAKVRKGLVACEYIILIFSFFFVMYSHSAFLKSRKKEFGLLSLFGMTRRQMNKMVLYENTVIAVLSIVCGILLGALFSKLFLMTMTQLLQVDSPIPFQLVPKALGVTALGFFLVFELISLFTLFRMRKTQIVMMLKAAKQPKALPVYSRWLVMLSVVCLGVGYALAYRMTVNTLMIYMLPVLFLTIFGSYFLFTQASVAVFRRLQRSKAFYYRQTNLLTVSQLIFKMKDNARMFFMVSLLSAVVLTAACTMYVFDQSAKSQLTDHIPQTVGYLESGGMGGHPVLDPDKVRQILKEDGVGLAYESKMSGISILLNIKLGSKPSAIETMIVSESDYNRQMGQLGKKGRAEVAANHAVFIFPFLESKTVYFKKGDALEVKAGGQMRRFEADGQQNVSLMTVSGSMQSWLVVDDAQFAELYGQTPDSEKLTAYGFELNNWVGTAETVTKIRAQVPESGNRLFTERVHSYLELKQTSALTMFIGLFVSILFFIAAGSMIYFKLFTELQEDQLLYNSLARMGVPAAELKRIVTTQMSLIFFVPFLVGSVHAAFALKALGNLLVASVWQYGALVVALFFAMQAIYFLLTRRSYLKRIAV
jgi:putative ABC transport system permease protein